MTARHQPPSSISLASQPKLCHGSSPGYGNSTAVSTLYRRMDSQPIVGGAQKETTPRTLQQTAVVIPRISRLGRTSTSEPRRKSPPDLVVNRNEGPYPCIPFFPHDGLQGGVAMGLAFYQEGMVMKQSSIEFSLPPDVRRIDVLPFVFRWPGYMHIRVKKNVALIDPKTGFHVTYGRLAQQVSEIFSTFIQRFGDDFDGSATGIQLGPKAVTFHNLRIHQVYIEQRTLQAEVSYTRRN